MFGNIGSILLSIPAAFWASVLTAIVAFFGIYIANKDNTKRLILQLEHDKEEKSRERIATLRREIYIKGAEEFVNLQFALARISQIEITDPRLLEPVQSFSAAATRLQLAAEPDTALKVNRLAFHYYKIYMELLGQAAPIARARVDSQIAKQWFETYSEEAKQTIGEIRRLNESGSEDQRLLDSLSSRYRLQIERKDKFYNDLNKSLNEVNRCTLSFNRHLLDHMITITPQHNEIFVDLRRDLGLIAEIEKFEELTEQYTREMLQYYESVKDAFVESFGSSQPT